jgi:hypothetical protein
VIESLNLFDQIQTRYRWPFLLFWNFLVIAGFFRTGFGQHMERLWRSLKYEQVYLAEYQTGSEARAGIGWWIDFYNRRRPHSSLADQTPDEAYTGGAAPSQGYRPGSPQPQAA